MIAIVGAGPAGLSAAIHAARCRTARVCVLEANVMAGRKLLITGGIDPQFEGEQSKLDSCGRTRALKG